MTDTDTALIASLKGFTPGPWEWDHNFSGLDGALGEEVIQAINYEGMYISEGPNAALIAAAPELHRIATDQAAEIERLREALGCVSKRKTSDEWTKIEWDVVDPFGQYDDVINEARATLKGGDA